MNVQIAEEDLKQLLDERDHLKAQVKQLQERGTQLLFEARDAVRDMKVLLQRIADLEASNIDTCVREFHVAMRLPAPKSLNIPSDERIKFRLRLVTEEFLELVDAALGENTMRPWWFVDIAKRLEWLIENTPVVVKPIAFFDATHDLDYVVAGTRVECGYDAKEGANEVHRANMRKLTQCACEFEQPCPRCEGRKLYPLMDGHKVIKPPGWTGPDIGRVLRDQGLLL